MNYFLHYNSNKIINEDSVCYALIRIDLATNKNQKALTRAQTSAKAAHNSLNIAVFICTAGHKILCPRVGKNSADQDRDPHQHQW